MDRNATVLAGAAMIAGAIAFGFWHQVRNSPFERCVRSKVAEVNPSPDRLAVAESQFIRKCGATFGR